MPDPIASTLSSSRNVCEQPAEEPAAPPKLDVAKAVRVFPQRSAVDTERAIALASISGFEQLIFDRVSQLGPGDEATISLAASVKADLMGGASGKVAIKREEDGSFTVTLKADVKAGVGVQAGLKAGANEPGAKVDASAGVKIDAGCKFRFETAEGTADFVDAASASSLVVMPALQAHMQQLGWLDDGALARMSHYVQHNTKTLSLGATTELQFSAGVNAVFAKMGVGASAFGGFQLEYDVAKQQLAVIAKLGAGGRGGVSVGDLGVGGDFGVESRTKIAFDVSQEAVLQAAKAGNLEELVASLDPKAAYREIEEKGKVKASLGGAPFAGWEHEMKRTTTEDFLSHTTKTKVELAVWQDSKAAGLKDTDVGPFTFEASATERHVVEGATYEEAKAKADEHVELTRQLDLRRSR